MDWKKVIESEELKVFEKTMGDSVVKIEARKNQEQVWEVFKTQIKGEKSMLISEHMIDDDDDVLHLIESLKNENRKSKLAKQKISLKRIYKEEFVEKWTFSLGKDRKNFLVVKYDNNIKVDIVMAEGLRYSEKTILRDIEEKLGLKEFGESIQYNIYYFTKHKKLQENNYEYTYMDIEFDFSE